jgi:hypothetical protein
MNTIENAIQAAFEYKALAQGTDSKGLKIHYQYMHNVFVDAAIELAINEGLGK